MAPKVKTLLTIFGLVFSVLSFICMVVAFSSPNWVEYYNTNRRERVFQKMGLWEACFNKWNYYKDYLGKTYNGCWWIFSFEYRPIWTWLNPAWFLAIQIMMTLTVMMQMITIMFVIFYIVHCCPVRKEKNYVLATCCMNFVGGAFIAISTIMFGIKAETDRQWLPKPDSNYLSWSFGFCVLSGFFALFAGMCLLVEFLRIRIEEQKSRRPAYQMKPVPRY